MKLTFKFNFILLVVVLAINSGWSQCPFGTPVVDPNLGNNAMIAEVCIDGLPASGGKLAVFLDQELRGAADIFFISSLGKAISQIAIKGNAGENLRFEICDPGNNNFTITENLLLMAGVTVYGTSLTDTVKLNNVDITPPFILSITSTTDSDAYKVGIPINVTVNFNEPTTLTTGENLTINLNTGRSISIENFALQTSVSGIYNVSAGDSSADLTVDSVTFLGSLQDELGNPAISPLTIPAGQNLGDNGDIVIDTEVPLITVTGDTKTIECGTVSPNFLVDVVVSDNLDTSLTINVDSSMVNLNSSGAYTVNYDINDDAGNSAEQKSRTYTVVDTTMPEIFISSMEVSVELGVTPNFLDGVSVMDNCDTSPLVTHNGNTAAFNANMVGTYSIIYTSSDSESNMSSPTTRIYQVVQPWIVEIFKNDDVTSSIQFGVAGTALDGFDAANDTTGLNTDDIFINNTDGPLSIDIRSIKDVHTWDLVIDATAGITSINWTGINAIPETHFLSLYEVDNSGNPISADVKNMGVENQLAVQPGAGSRFYKIRYAKDLSVGMVLKKGWNLVSFPIKPTESTVSQVFSKGISSGENISTAVWSVENEHYLKPTTIDVLKGYWVYAFADELIVLAGTPAVLDSGGNLLKDLNMGWNLYGPVKSFTLTNSLPANIGSIIWTWDGAKDVVARNMEIFKAYWIYSEANGVQFNLAK